MADVLNHKPKPLISDAEIRRRKKTQATTSRITGTLGLAALGGTALATKPGQKALKYGFGRAGKEVPKHLHAAKQEPGIRNSTMPILATSAGIGSLSAFNFARYTDAESRKRTPVSKSCAEDGFYGVIGKAYDPEENRMKRSKGYEAATVATAGAGGAVTAHHGIKAAGKLKALRANDMADTAKLKISGMQDANPNPNKRGSFYVQNRNPVHMAVKTKDIKSSITRAVDAEHLKGAGKSVGATAAAAALTAGAVAANRHIRSKTKKEGSWTPYVSKSDLTNKSAFGVDHD